MMDGMMGMMHGWMWLVALLLVAILAGIVILIMRSGRGGRAAALMTAATAVTALACGGGAAPGAGASPAATSTPGAGAATLSPAAGATEVKTYEIHGRIEAIAADRRTVTLDHKEIPGLMPAMKMDYGVDSPAVLQGLSAGDAVHGRFEVRGGDQYVVTTLSK
jgi:Cu/Ag efflux protein CusF